MRLATLLCSLATALARGRRAAPPPLPPPPSALESVLATLEAFARSEATLYALLAFLLFAPVVYFVLNTLIPVALGTQDLKKKYDAKWALVTGASSGIGKELARALLAQELDVIALARDEPVFDATVKELRAEFPARSIVSVKADLSDPSGAWMSAVKKACPEERDVQCLFLNAGFIVIGLFEKRDVKVHLANLHCNLTSNIWLSHFFYERMVARAQKGCIVFTSSSASYLPNPMAALYAATKSGLSAFAASLAVEARPKGIHVHAMHPSPVNSRFTAGGGNAIKQGTLDAMKPFYKMATGPEALPPRFFEHVGRSAVIADLGAVSMALRLLVHFIGFNFMALMTALTAASTSDYKRHLKGE